MNVVTKISFQTYIKEEHNQQGILNVENNYRYNNEYICESINNKIILFS